jgi:hypothetical protein
MSDVTYADRQPQIAQTTTAQLASRKVTRKTDKSLAQKFPIAQSSTAQSGTASQMQMYVNYYDLKIKLDGENSTIGIVLCKQQNNAVVEITLPKDANIHAREYRLYLPSKAELKQKLIEWAREGRVGDE